MKALKGRGVSGGSAKGFALVTRMPMNLTASFTKLPNIVPGRASQIQDPHHDLYGKKVARTVLVFPACIGSTYTGMVLLELIDKGQAPAALIVQDADTLLVSGVVLAENWCGKHTPVVEYSGDDLYDLIHTGDAVEVDGETGEIRVG